MKTETFVHIAVGALVVASQATIFIKLNRTENSIKAMENTVNDVSNKVEVLENFVIERTESKIKVSKKEFDCLARNVYFEAGVEDRRGKLAVAQVTMNRANDKRWGKGICNAVYAKSQFSWTLQKKKLNSVPQGMLWNRSVEAADEFLAGHRVTGLEYSKFYHTDYIKTPKWADENKRVAVIGQHIFYSEARQK